MTVASGAALAGSGIIGGAVTVNAGAHLTPGSSIGTLNVNSLALAPNSLLDYELGTTASSDLTIISSAGGLALSGGSVNVTGVAGFGIGEYRLLDYTNSFTGSPSNLTLGTAPSGFIYSFIDNPATTSIDVVVAVPEPAASLTFIALSFPVLAGRRRSAGAPVAL